MELYFWSAVELIGYAALVWAAVKATKKILQVRSALFGVGVATTIAGFLWNQALLLEVHDALMLRIDEPVYGVLCFASLLIGLAGILLIATDLALAVRELTAWTVKKDRQSAK